MFDKVIKVEIDGKNIGRRYDWFNAESKIELEEKRLNKLRI